MRALTYALVLTATAVAQRDRGGNPLRGNSEAVAQGGKLYSVRCAPCHGKDARGGDGPNLYKSRIVVSSPDRRFFDVVKNGIPGGEMAPLKASDEQVWQIITYVHSIAKPGQGPPVAGDADAGRSVFREAGCARCHIAEGKGGILGPDLSSIALQLASAQIREAVLAPEARIAEGFQAVTVQTKDGRRIDGTLKNEDNFSVQLMRGDGDLVALPRDVIVEVRAGKRSLMPAETGQKLSPEELQNLLAFLDRQRAPFVRFQMSFQTY